GFFSLHLFRSQRLVVVSNRHARHRLARFHIEPSLGSLRRLLAGAEYMFRRRVIGGCYLVSNRSPHQFEGRRRILERTQEREGSQRTRGTREQPCQHGPQRNGGGDTNRLVPSHAVAHTDSVSTLFP